VRRGRILWYDRLGLMGGMSSEAFDFRYPLPNLLQFVDSGGGRNGRNVAYSMSPQTWQNSKRPDLLPPEA
jgi:hypothetical protein